MVDFKTQYTPRTRVQTQIDSETNPPLTEQAHKPSCDVNHIINKCRATGLPDPHWTEQNYGEFEPVEFQTAMDTLAKGQSAYEELPGHLRQKFRTPMEYMEFVTNPENQQKLIDLGLATKKISENPGIHVDVTELRGALRQAINDTSDDKTEEK